MAAGHTLGICKITRTSKATAATNSPPLSISHDSVVGGGEGEGEVIEVNGKKWSLWLVVVKSKNVP
jgi:hypothetical protein